MFRKTTPLLSPSGHPRPARDERIVSRLSPGRAATAADLVAALPLARAERVLEPRALVGGQDARVVVDPAVGRRRDGQGCRRRAGKHGEQHQQHEKRSAQAHTAGLGALS
jgi:hypothetical protein